MKINLSKNPKIYQLSREKLIGYYYWRKFLQKSDSYITVCNLINDYSIPGEKLPEICKTISPKNKTISDAYFGWIYSRFTPSELKAVFIEDTETTLYEIISRIYPLFQDVTSPKSLIHLWLRLKLLYDEADTDRLGAMFFGCDHLWGHLDLTKFVLSERLGREPSVDEFIKEFVATILQSDLEICFINTNSVRRADLVAIFNKQLKFMNITPKPMNKKLMKYAWEAFILDGHIRKDTFDLALAAYELWKNGASRESAASSLFPQKYNDDLSDKEDLKKRYDSLVQQALMLIRNAETGTFPGKFSKKRKSDPPQRGRYIEL